MSGFGTGQRGQKKRVTGGGGPGVKRGRALQKAGNRSRLIEQYYAISKVHCSTKRWKPLMKGQPPDRCQKYKVQKVGSTLLSPPPPSHTRRKN